MNHWRKPVRTGLAGLLALALGACAATGDPQALPPGDWGGSGVALTLTAEGGRIVYDCAAGTIFGVLRPDEAGRFRANGTHTPNIGGPERLDHPRASVPARYAGQVRGSDMTLTVETPSDGVEMGPFSLRRSASPTLHPCL